MGSFKALLADTHIDMCKITVKDILTRVGGEGEVQNTWDLSKLCWQIHI